MATSPHLVLARFLCASLGAELTSKMESLLAGPLGAHEAGEIAQWFEANFSFQGTKTPKGQKVLKDQAQKLHWFLANGVKGSSNLEAVKATIQDSWDQIHKQLPDLVKNFSAEGGKVVPKEIVLNGNTYQNISGFSEAELTKYAKRVDQAFDSLKGWRRQALAGGVTVALAGPKDFRGTATGTYRSEQDVLYVRATPAVLKRSGHEYAGFEYILVHELGHRFERKHRVPLDFDKPEWWTSRYSRSDGESFAELFALSNFDIKGQGEAETLEKFETVMS